MPYITPKETGLLHKVSFSINCSNPFKGLPDHITLTFASLEEYETGQVPDYAVGINLEDAPGKLLYSDAFEAEYKSVFEAVVAPALYGAGVPPDAPVELFEYTQLS
jgi:hypothetical protein